jgi:aminopeptidase YwaD
LAQDSVRVRSTLDELCSDRLAGRGYVAGGDRKAARFLRKAFQTAGLSTLPGNTWFQAFYFSVNSFPGPVSLKIDGKSLVPGRDFLVSPQSPSIKGTYTLRNGLEKTESCNASNTPKPWMLFDTTGTGISFSRKQADSLRNCMHAAGNLWTTGTKLTWSVSQKQDRIPEIVVVDSVFPHNPSRMEVRIRSQFKKQHKARNVIGYLPGTGNCDSALFITAHYDHLGRMGREAVFRGANDNASGVSMLLELAHWFSEPENRPRHDLVFVAFAGEEAGLIGSKHFVESDWYPLKRIRFLLNLDLLGGGEEGLMVVNATIHPTEFQLLKELNDSLNLLPDLRQRGPAANSDHHWFAQSGVPAFFTYTLGSSKAYHDIYDNPNQLSLKAFNNCHRLFRLFLTGL